MILCDNDCPFEDCDKKYPGEDPPGVDRSELSIVNLASTCDRYTRYVADQINSTVSKGRKMNRWEEQQ